MDDDSLSEGSVLTVPEDDADGEGSDASEGEGEATASTKADKTGDQVNGDGKHAGKTDPPTDPPFGSKVADTEAMLNGMKISEPAEGAEEIHFEDMDSEGHGKPTEETVPAEAEQSSRRETFAERKRREHEEYIKERNENPAFVPTRGGFFLHDKRSESGSSGNRPFNNKKTRPHGLIVDSNTGRLVLDELHGFLLDNPDTDLTNSIDVHSRNQMRVKDSGHTIFMRRWREMTLLLQNLLIFNTPAHSMGQNQSLPRHVPHPRTAHFQALS